MQQAMIGDRDVVLKGAHLKNKKVDLIVAGGIAAVESPKLIRELRRYGAEVRVLMTSAATKFITPLSLEWAAKSPVVTDLTGSAEHISQSDIVVVAPATLDFVAKASWGFADSAALTLLQSALARRPVFFAPSMHESLAENPLYQENRKRLSKLKNVFFLEPTFAEGKYKAQGFEATVARICHHAGSMSALRGKSVAISLGPTRSKIDDMRFISNRSSGALGLSIADELFRRGANVHAVAGPLQVAWPDYLEKIDVETNLEMKSALRGLVQKTKAKAIIFAAAVLDFDVIKPRTGKTSSTESLSVALRPSQKLIQDYAKTSSIKVGFKLEAGVSEKELLSRARRSLDATKASFVVANRLEDVSQKTHRAFLVFKNKDSLRCDGRHSISLSIANQIEELI